jgi:hypothetical protein
MPTTYKAIATVTVGSGGGSVVFTNIPQTYTDLVLYISGRTDWTTDTNDQVRIYLNGNTSNYSHKLLLGTGSATDGDGTQNTAPGVNAQTQTNAMTANTFSNDYIYIPNYTSAEHKTVGHDHTTENNATLSYITLGATVWANTSAVTSITVGTFRGADWRQYSSATLYGIKNS